VLSQPNQDLSLLSREELIARLLECNQTATFQFTPAWLHRQRTHRLRSLLTASQQEHEAKGRTLR
jgi:hypothetical protein